MLSAAHIQCTMEHTGLVRAFAPDPSVFQGEYLMEKLETTAGWSMPAPDEDWMQGHVHAVQDFIESAATGRSPRSDGRLGRDVVETIYTAYLSAAEGRRVEIRPRS